jgi:hypothetical protein
MKTLLLLGGLAACGALPLHAQQLRLAYAGETFTHYGLKAGYEHVLRTFPKPDSPARGDLLVSLNLTVYRHPHNHVGVILAPELAYRRTGRRGGFAELAVAPAFFRYFLEGKTYEASADGGFRRVRLAGRNAFLPTVAIGFGKDLSVRRNVPLSWYARINLMQQRPYNAGNLVRFGGEIGILKSINSK